jgi:imidazolonepropionase-like amidohydrolase
VRAYTGRVWPGGDAEPFDDGVVLVDGGRVVGVGAAIAVPDSAEVVRGAWVGPPVVDAHVHLAFGTYDAMRATGVVAVRDLGAPPADAARWRSPYVAVAGPLLTAPGGYPSRSWGAKGFARFVATPDDARAAVRSLDADVVKVALEPSGGPVPDLDVVRAVVAAAHDRGLRVTAHALTEEMVLRALDGGVDELCHTPVEPLSPAALDRVAASGVPVVSTIQTLGAGAARNAKALHANGVRLLYGTDLGNGGTFPGVDQRELDRLAEAGLGRLGALRSATEWSAAAYGLNGFTGRIAVGEPARLVVLDRDPVAAGWGTPLAVVG